MMHPHLYKRACPLVGWLVGWLVCRSVMLLSKLMKNGLNRFSMIKTVMDEEEIEARRKEGQGRRRDGESEKMKN